MQDAVLKSAKQPRIGKKIRQAIDLLLDGSCKNQKAVCERLKLSPSYLSRSLKSEKIRALVDERTRQTIIAGKLAATATTIRLIESAKSEHVQLQASEFLLGLNGMHAKPNAPGVTINNTGAAGYILVLADPRDEVLEGTMIDNVGGILHGRMMTTEERRSGALNRSKPEMIDITPERSK